MEQLSETQQTAIKKASSDRLRLLLLKAGYEEEVVLAFNRDELMSKYAECLLADPLGDSDHEGEDASRADLDRDRARYEHELMMKRMELESHERIERDRLAIEQEKLAIERAKLKQDCEIKMAELEAKERAENDETRVLKRYGEALAQVLAPQTDEVTELPAYFRGVEMQFEKLKIPSHFRARLIFKYLSAKARALCARLTPEVRDDYSKMKDAIFKEYGLSAKCFLDKFNQVRKGASDTFVLYGSKLEGILKQYLQARGVEDYDSLISLILADRIKSELSDQCLKHVVSVESAMESPHWLKAERLTVIVDEFVANCRPSSNFRAASSPVSGQTTHLRTGNQLPTKFSTSDKDKSMEQRQEMKPRFSSENTGGKRCHFCNSPYHLQARCHKRQQQQQTAPGVAGRSVNATCVAVHSETEPGQGHRPGASGPKPAQAVVQSASQAGVAGPGARTVDDKYAHVPQPPPGSLVNVNKVIVDLGNDQFAYKLDQVISLFAKNADVECMPDKHRVTSVSVPGVCTSNFDLPRFLADVQSAMHYADVTMQDDHGKTLMLNCLFDSGSEVSVVKDDVIRALDYQVLGEVQLKGFDRHNAQGHLISAC